MYLSSRMIVYPPPRKLYPAAAIRGAAAGGGRAHFIRLVKTLVGSSDHVFRRLTHTHEQQACGKCRRLASVVTSIRQRVANGATTAGSATISVLRVHVRRTVVKRAGKAARATGRAAREVRRKAWGGRHRQCTTPLPRAVIIWLAGVGDPTAATSSTTTLSQLH